MSSASPSRRSRPHVVVAGQMPPPVGGQNINNKRIHDLLASQEDLMVSHLNFEFTKEWTGMRRAGFDKVLELFRVAGRAIQLRRRAPIDFLLYPSGGPHLVPIIRDLFLLPYLALLSRRVVVHFQAAGLAEHLERSPGWLRGMCRLVYGKCASDAAVLTSFGKQDAEAAGIERVSVVPNAFEDQAGGVYRRDRRDGVSLLNVGHICEDKGVPQLIEAFGRIADDYPEATLVLVGEPLAPYSEERLKEDINKTGVSDQIQWRGVLGGEDLAGAYREGDLFVFSSLAPYESFGLVLIEAMQWSLPVLVTDWRANVSVCAEDFGGLVIGEPEKDLATALEGSLRKALERQEEWTEWGRRNREIYEGRYTVKHMLDNLRSLIGVDREGTAGNS